MSEFTHLEISVIYKAIKSLGYPTDYLVKSKIILNRVIGGATITLNDVYIGTYNFMKGIFVD